VSCWFAKISTRARPPARNSTPLLVTVVVTTSFWAGASRWTSENNWSYCRIAGPVSSRWADRLVAAVPV
jgi:hypothetical protein